MIFEREMYLGLSSVDQAGVLFYPELFRHAHDVYESFMASIGYPLERVFEEGLHAIPIVHAEADYRLPMRHGEAFVVKLRVQRVGTTSFTLSYDFVGPGGEPCAQVKTVQAFVDRAGGGTVSIPDALRRRLDDFR